MPYIHSKVTIPVLHSLQGHALQSSGLKKQTNANTDSNNCTRRLVGSVNALTEVGKVMGEAGVGLGGGGGGVVQIVHEVGVREGKC